ncbi:DUF418 domain-containing protein [Bacteroides caecigallinarum]|uniref:DUF418 domain-containing protein n=1 Tax=Bacteroides caecigallinarum TaxID=1411144 RepID=UPI001956E8DA|nr:DUF418 domain-containing protein [Bacteroides caecigallinarum]MBM6882070.1 DUF418 domain-containing protein [Bacteroides caecigallinarum]
MKTLNDKSRNVAIDALRGFAVMGIILLHNIEHFNFYSFPDAANETTKALDTTLWDMMFFAFSGKTYAIFALLFGFTFYLQSRSSEKRGEDFRNRYMWRLLLLLGFGFINAAFFPGEILVLYALVGLVLVPVRHWGNKALFAMAVFLMLQPVEWVKVLYSVFNPLENPQQMIFSLGDVYPQLGGHSFWEMVKVNLVTGQLASLNWAWCYGRVFQTASLFMLGILLGRLGYFDASSDDSLRKSRDFWVKVLCISLPLTLVMYYFKEFVYTQIEIKFMLSSLKTVLNSWYNFFFMLCIVASFLLLYWTCGGKVQRILAPYGRMSLTDYVSQSVIGSFLYFGYGLELHKVCGTTYSLLVGIVFLALQVTFAHWWFKHFKRGPLETVWHKLTWIGKAR